MDIINISGKWRVEKTLISQPQSPLSFALSSTPKALLCNARILQAKPSINFLLTNTSLELSHRVISPVSHRTRTTEEFNAGHVEGSINVPYMFKEGGGMVKNPNFIQEVSSLFSKDAEILVGCQSGRRSLMAAKDLIASEFMGITDVGGGYSAWVQSGFPVKKSTL